MHFKPNGLASCSPGFVEPWVHDERNHLLKGEPQKGFRLASTAEDGTALRFALEKQEIALPRPRVALRATLGCMTEDLRSSSSHFV